MASPVDLFKILVLAFQRSRRSFGRPQTVRLRPIGNEAVALRPQTSDGRVVLDVFVGLFHLPPSSLRNPKVIWDLGSNIGLTVAHYASLFPSAKVTGLEPDAEMAEIARTNLAPWGDRCKMITGAAWSSDRELAFEVEAGEEFGSHVTGEDRPGSIMVTGHSLNTLLKDEIAVDYMKIDIEGAEGEILTVNTEWAAKVNCVSVEIHPPHTVQTVSAALENLGFRVMENERHWASVTGIRES
ncbi:MAG: FkbM family methyltransferase [Acidimicrobiales bacterium]